ncbi:MAG TPA: response regulator [Spirochaetota bacterium]|jgi:DNA-binding response OmpR family regulator|nr:response regulator [Spirochaetota bacterium]OQA97505.1 MAG: Alkaline phosphatase synthesis transcriptional regulatory protein PhoP [Spirochaetes bacterium ADurb.Bin218]HOK02658.1 response regulator [Spirochaetota bacterium]HOK93342.1 response regulator [Spirochaetota bacterium]HOQ11823.1 response regulator [Spirochaetota bacterium]
MATKKILLVDDDMDIIESMKAILASEGHIVFTAGNEKDCMDEFNKEKPDVVFLDLMMEKMDSGIRLCREIRSKDKNVKIYLLSAVGDETAGTLDIHEIGFNGAMSKPVNAEELTELVK